MYGEGLDTGPLQVGDFRRHRGTPPKPSGFDFTKTPQVGDFRTPPGGPRGTVPKPTGIDPLGTPDCWIVAGGGVFEPTQQSGL